MIDRTVVLKRIEEKKRVKMLLFKEHKHIDGLMIWSKKPFAWFSIREEPLSIFTVKRLLRFKRHIVSNREELQAIIFIVRDGNVEYAKIDSEEIPSVFEKL